MDYDWSVSNYKVVTLFETFPMIGGKTVYKNIRWLWLQKKLEHMFPWGTWAFARGKYIVPQVTCPSPLGTWSLPKENSLFFKIVVFFTQFFLKIAWGTCLGLAFNPFFPGEVTSLG
jgi:hypothetical protein